VRKAIAGSDLLKETVVCQGLSAALGGPPGVVEWPFRQCREAAHASYRPVRSKETLEMGAPSSPRTLSISVVTRAISFCSPLPLTADTPLMFPIVKLMGIHIR
jgi:hypothetical protein